ncbi:MAG: twin-arginine translocation signal domain-containing protein [Acidimicrobiales bacterium]|jgi:hypothetical protein|nr:twin-arginine translocation signal domain-containing protein [Acidimicrobiales bacterium]
MDGEIVEEAGGNRRSFIKKAAIAGSAAVWAPPVIASFTSPASAASGPADFDLLVARAETGEWGFQIVSFPASVNACPPGVSINSLKIFVLSVAGGTASGSGTNAITAASSITDIVLRLNGICSNGSNSCSGDVDAFDVPAIAALLPGQSATITNIPASCD